MEKKIALLLLVGMLLTGCLHLRGQAGAGQSAEYASSEELRQLESLDGGDSLGPSSELGLGDVDSSYLDSSE